MSKKRKANTDTPDPRLLQNGLSDLVNTMKTHQTITGGSQLAGYDTTAFNNNYSLITHNWTVLTYLYSSNGLIQTAIDLPIQDALSKGIEIESLDMSSDQISQIQQFMERENQWELLRRAWAWGRLYGGGALIINTNQDPSTPLHLGSLHNSPMSFYDVDRWQLVAPHDVETDLSSPFHLHGTKIDPSRIIIIKGKSAPWYLRKQLRGWSLSECEHIFRPLNLYLKTENVLYEVIDEAKVDVFRLEGLTEKLQMSPHSTSDAVLGKVQLTNELKSVVNAVVLDKQDEFETKTQSFAGISDLMKENRIGVAAALRMPVTKLFGLSASGFNTGESDLESYNQMVQSNIREKMKPVIRRLIECNMYHLWGQTFDFTVNWPPLRALTSAEEQKSKDSKYNRATDAFTKGLINKEQWLELMKGENIFSINLDSTPTPPLKRPKRNIFGVVSRSSKSKTV